MRTFLTVLLLLSGITGFAQPAFDYKRDFKPFVEQSQDKQSPLYYQKLLIRFLDRDTTMSNMETLAMMIGYTEDSHYKPFEDMDPEKEVFDLNEEGKYDDAVIKGRKYLQTHPLSLRVNKETSYAYFQKQMQDSADYYMDLVEKLMNAMIYSGTGKKPSTPIFSLGLADGEYFIPNIGMKVLNTDTDWNDDNLFLEIIDASKSGDDHINYYFVIQHAKNRIDDDKVNESTDKKKKKEDKKKKDKDKQKGKVEAPAPGPKTE
ncbi:MAG: DUF4919 domain-containing protein [Bacteroidota bacterium]